MKNLEKIKDKLKGSYFDLASIDCSNEGYISARVYENCLIVEPQTLEIKKELMKNPYIPKLQSHKHFYALFWFPLSIELSVLDKNFKSPKFTHKYITRYQNLMQAQREGNVSLWIAIDNLKYSEWLDLEYIPAKPYNRETDFKDEKADTTCKILAKEHKPYQEIKRVSLNYSTLLILQNAKENGNKSLYHYLETGSKSFYTDCIINYILEHSNLLDPEYFSYENAPKEVRMPARELFKLYPHRTFSLKAPEGVTLTNITRPCAKRISKDDILSFNFSNEFLQKYRAIITKSENNNTSSFIEVPMFFVLQALQNDNFTSGGFKFLLWFLAFYRMKSPKIFHSLKTILKETGADLKHGYKKPIETLNHYFNYLFSVNALDIPQPLEFITKEINSPPNYDGKYIKLRKPKLKTRD